MRKTSLPSLLLILILWAAFSPGEAGAKMPPIQRTVLDNKLVLLSSAEHTLPFATLHLLVDAGSRNDPSGREGLAFLTAKSILLGTSRRSAAALDEELDFMGASLQASCGRDYATLTLRVLKKDLEKGLDLFLDVLTRPTFPGEEVRREKEKILAALQTEEDQPEEVAEKAFIRNLFQDSPYGHAPEGTRESVPRITREDLVRFYKTYYHPNISILAVVGDVDAALLKGRMLPLFEKWKERPVTRRPFSSAFAQGPKTVKIDRNITQANIIIGEAGVSRDNPDYYALTVMNYLLGGGGLSSRLMEEIRNRRGLAYSVASFLDPGKFPGSFQIVLQTKNSSAREAISHSLAQMERMRKEPVSAKELEDAKRYLIGSFPMRLDTQAKLAGFLGQVEYYGLGLAYPEKYPKLIRAISREDILRVARSYLHPEKRILVIVANQKEAGVE